MDRTYAEIAFLAKDRVPALLADAAQAHRAAPRRRRSLTPRQALAAAFYRAAAWLDER